MAEYPAQLIWALITKPNFGQNGTQANMRVKLYVWAVRKEGVHLEPLELADYHAPAGIWTYYVLDFKVRT